MHLVLTIILVYMIHKTMYYSILGSIKLSEPDSSERGCEDLIKNWLKHAPQRTKIKRRRTE